MPLLSGLRALWRNVAHRTAVERELEDEVRAYAALLADDLRSKGLSPREADRAARIELGGVENVKEAVRQAKHGARLHSWWQDLGYAVRVLRRTPSFTAAAVGSLALGIGATAAVFGLFNALQLRTLPVPAPENLAMLRLEGPRCCRHTGRNRQVSVPLWREIASEQQAFAGLFAFADTRFNLAPQGEVRYVDGLFVSGDFFTVLGVQPILGRILTSQDDQPGCTGAGAVISHALWRTEFGGRADVLSQTLALRSGRHPIVGVMPAEFLGVETGRRFEVALPICMAGFERADHWWLAVMGRLKPGWTPDQATAHFSTLAPRLLRAATPPTYVAEQAREFLTLKFSVHAAHNGVSVLRGQYQEPLWLLCAVAGLVLIAACANVASLGLVRSTAREPEFALRAALGASVQRLVRQLLVEGVVIAALGAVAGLVLAHLAQDAVLALLSTTTDRIVLDLGPDWRLFGFTALLIGLTTIAFAVAPALRARHWRLGSNSAARLTAHRSHVHAREVLVAVQIAMSVVLVSAALLFMLTARNLLAADRGFRVTDALFAHVFMSETDPPPDRRAEMQRQVTARLAELPGIAAVAHASTPPLVGTSWGTVLRVPDTNGELKGEANRNQVSAGYFKAMLMPLLAGRQFNDADTPSSVRVAVVNETLVRKFFAGVTPLGRRIIDGNDTFEIVGVVRDSKLYSLREPFRPIAYTAASQFAPPLTIRFVLRSATGAAPGVEDVRPTLAEMLPTAGVRFGTLREVVNASMQTERLMAALSVCFGAIAILLAAVGVYGVVSCSAASRRREIAIRLALGAMATHVMRAVLGRILVVGIAGLIAGALLTIPAVRLARSLAYGIDPGDPRVLLSVGGIILASGVVAAWIPARRALRTDPLITLKTE
jgi:putative ABC transport system permease protein